MVDFKRIIPRDLRNLIRKEEFTKETTGAALDYAQANLVILPKEYALDFLVFTQRNPKACPVLEITDPGNPEPKNVAPGADLRTDLPLYRIYRDGAMVEEVPNITKYWKEDLMGFLLGCSYTFENALIKAGIPVRHIDENHNDPMYITNIECKPAGMFKGPMVVSMRPILPSQVIKAVEVTSRFPKFHGSPVHIGDPSEIGIEDLNNVDYGEASTVNPGEVPVFWACGVTPQAVAIKAGISFMITHSPGHMFVLDMPE